MTFEPAANVPDMLLSKARQLIKASLDEARADLRPGPTRQQVHELVDHLLNAGNTVAVMTQSIHVPARRALRASLREAVGGGPNGAGPPPRATSASEGGLDFVVLGPAAPGYWAERKLTVHNKGQRGYDGLKLACSVLESTSGARIPGSAVTVSPELLDLYPDSSRAVSVKINVPVGAEPGTYTGKLTAVGQPRIAARVQVEVK